MAVNEGAPVQPHSSRRHSSAPPRSGRHTSDTGGTILSLSVERNRLRALLLENISGHYRLAGWLVLPGQGDRHLPQQFTELCRQLSRRLGRPLWDEQAQQPLLHSEDITRLPPLSQVTLTASPRPLLRVWLAALSTGNSLAAAQQAIQEGPAQLVSSLILDGDTDMGQVAQSLIQNRPDVIALAGGYDLPYLQNHQPLLRLARLVLQALALSKFRRPPVVLVAGSRWAAEEVHNLFQERHIPVAIVHNVLPSPGQVQSHPLAQALHLYYTQSCMEVESLQNISRWVADPAHIFPLEANFIRLVQVWRQLHDLKDLHALYCANDRWLSVWSAEGETAPRLHFALPDTRLTPPAGWPPLQLLSGQLPQNNTLPGSIRWWDRGAMAPVVAAAGAVAPAAMLQTLTYDILIPNVGND
jgi:hypothetical protein